MAQVRAAIVGIGWWAGELTQAARQVPDLKITACASRTPNKVKAFAEKFGLTPYSSLKAVLAAPDIDAVMLTTPHSTHHGQIVAAARAGKHVFVEKPLTITTSDARDALRACKEAGVTLTVGLNRRFSNIAKEAKRHVQSDLGQILHVECNSSVPAGWRHPPGGWRASRAENPGGALLSVAPHMLDLIIWTLGPIKSVAAIVARQALPGELEDTAVALFRFESGMTGYFGSMFAVPFASALRYFGTKGNLELTGEIPSPEAKLTLIQPPPGGAGRPVITTETPAWTNTLVAELDAFAATCNGQKPPIVNGTLVHNVAVLEAWIKSAENGGAWTLVDTREDERQEIAKDRAGA